MQLDASGRPQQAVWLTQGTLYKVALAEATESDPPSNFIWVLDNVSGLGGSGGGSGGSSGEWTASPTAGTYISPTSFSLIGDQSAIFRPGRAVQIVDSGGTKYGFVKTSVFGVVTTITLDQNSDALASPISSVSYGFDPDNTSLPMLGDDIPVRGDVVDRTKQVKEDLDGITTGTTRSRRMPDYDIRLGNIPAGIIAPYAGSTIPTGWLACDGASLLRATYPALFTAIGTTWGAVDGTHFTMPDFRGRTVIGDGTGAGLTPRTLATGGGAETVLLDASTVPAHDHGSHAHQQAIVDTATNTGTATLATFGQGGAGAVATNTSIRTAGTAASVIALGTGNTTPASFGGGGAHANMQPFAVVKYIISY